MEIYTSGIANNTTGEGACSVVIYINGEPLIQNGKPVEFARRFDNTTNIKMLQMALIGAVKCVPKECKNVTIYTPNEWATKVSDGIIRALKARENGNTSGNDDLWLKLNDLFTEDLSMAITFSLSDPKSTGYKRAHKLAKELL